jgi:peptidoglycan/LPS O-acetylase OafA/YrhL
MSARDGFRPDVEGLRAVAIGAVVLSHAGVSWAGGGYVGVDVFFVISGFLITGLLMREAERTGTVSLSRFYARRVKRLMPQAVAVVLFVAAGASLWLSVTRAEEASRDVLAAAAYVVNWRFSAQATDYFASGSEDGPLDHFWSLAVEEQYYFVWPLLLLLITWPLRRRGVSGRRTVGTFLALGGLCSLGYALALVAAGRPEAYFSTPARAWELALGGLLAVALPEAGLGRRRAAAGAWCGVLAVGASVLTFDESTAVPGLPTLLPTLGAAALIAAGTCRERSRPIRALTLPPVRYVGRISYAWYVWHWPVLVFAAALWGPLSLPAGLLVAAFSLVPAVITYRLIEEPFRHLRLEGRRLRLTLAAAPAAALAMAAASIALVTSLPTVGLAAPRDARGAEAFPQRGNVQLAATALRPPPRKAEADRSRAYEDGCLLDKAAKEIPACVYGDPDSPTHVVLFGDSHAMQYFPALESIATRRHWRLVMFTRSGCPPSDAHVMNPFGRKPYPECPAWREDVLRRIEQIERPDLVVASGSARYTVLRDGRFLDRARSNQALLDGYAVTLARLRRAADRVAVIRDPARPPGDVPSCVASNLHNLRACAFSDRGGSVTPDPIVTGARRAGVTRILDPRERLCVRDLCPAVIGNVLVYRNSGHLTATYVATMSRWFARRLPALTSEAERVAGAAAVAQLDCRPHRRRFRTLPRLRPPGWCVKRRRDAEFSPGHLLVTPRRRPSPKPGEQWGPAIVSNAGELLWFSPRREQAHDLKVVRVRGQAMLAFFERRGNGGHYQLLDQHYRPAGRIAMGHGYLTNMHELQVTDRGTAYLNAYPRVQVPGVGTVVDYVVQEVDIATGAVLFEWHALDHVPLEASYRPPGGTEWDYFHGNSIDPPPGRDGTLLISSRNTSAVYAVDRQTGKVSWVLGGKLDRFGLAEQHPGWRFCAQHDARRLPNGDITLFDNGGTNLPSACSVHPARVMQFRLDPRQRSAQLVWSLGSATVSRSGGGLFPGWVGNAQRGPAGDTLVNWGNEKRVTDHAASGAVKLLLRLQRWTYRAVRARWVGRPLGRPRIAGRRRGASRVDLWASWNGATEIRRWRVLAGPAPDALRSLGPESRFKGLETRLRVRTAARWLAVEALDASGKVLGRSRALSLRAAAASAARPPR